MQETDDLTPLGHQILEHWTKYRPKMVAMLTARNQLQQAIFAAQELTGDFSALLKLGPQYQLYDPTTARVAAGGRIQRDPFPGNIIPSNKIDPVAQSLAKFWPAPSAAGTADSQLNFSYNNASNPRRSSGTSWRVPS